MRRAFLPLKQLGLLSVVGLLACSSSDAAGVISDTDPSDPGPDAASQAGRDAAAADDGASDDDGAAATGDGAVGEVDAAATGDGSPMGTDAAPPSDEVDAASPPPPDGAVSAPDGGSPLVDAAVQSDAGVVEPEPRVLRFIVFGDGGTGEDGQKKVASAVKQVCAARGCEFALYLGDNIYDDGVTGATDAQFQDKFETPYAELDFPFYLALGNHDYGSGGSNIFPEDARSAAQVEYTAYSDKWNLPHYYYSFRQGDVAFFVIDSNAIMLDDYRPVDEQQAWLDREMAASDARWKIVLGHHGYLSNGEHGNAGSYDGLGGVPFFERFNGARMKSFVEESVCGKANVYFAGHDHHREWLEPACGTNFIISGAAAKLRTIVDRNPPTHIRWNDASKLGFLWVEIEGDTMTGLFHDENGVVDYEDVITR